MKEVFGTMCGRRISWGRESAAQDLETQRLGVLSPPVTPSNSSHLGQLLRISLHHFSVSAGTSLTQSLALFCSLSWYRQALLKAALRPRRVFISTAIQRTTEPIKHSIDLALFPLSFWASCGYSTKD